MIINGMWAAPVHAAPSGAPADIELIHDGPDQNGKWVQRYRIVIGPGGTLGHASLAIFGDEKHVDQLFQAAKESNASLANPSNVPVGQQFEITIDPTEVYVLKDSHWEGNRAARVDEYYNDVREVSYGQVRTGVRHTVEFPAGKPAKTFKWTDENEAVVEVPAGSKLIDYTYNQGDDFQKLVEQLYGKG
ncbi:MAG: hypothetical protein HY329_24440, partial [Chloroflexi bacterium]|nr:hypothetical protein [Chloroflexota bacterium]